MKQHITPKQLDELSEKGKEKLRRWMVENDYYTPLISADFSEQKKWEETTPRPSIGQMIEFLDKRASLFSIHQPSSQSLYGNKWILEFIPNKVIAEKELCDCLWEAVKEILEK